MSATFSQTTRSLAADGSRRATLVIAIAFVILAGWGVWFFRGDVSEYETSTAARVEVGRAAHAIDAPVAGTVVTAQLALGNIVHAGDVVMEIDAEVQRRRLAEERASLDAITPEIDALRRTVDAETEVLRADRLATSSELNQGRAEQHAAELGATLAADESARATTLFGRGSATELEAVRAKNAAEKTRATAEALALGVTRSEGDRWTRETKTRVAIEDLRRDITMLEGRRATTLAAIDVLLHEIERRTVKSPIDGRVGDSALLKVGAFVHEGERLGAIVPPGDLRVVAEFAPSAALGRIHPGQYARVRLDGFPWTEYGTVSATVTEIADEPRDGHIRVELSVVADPASRIPLEHGLPGKVEVLVQHTTPAKLVARAIGKLAMRSGSDANAPGGGG